ncbi:MAG: 1,4-dihydroxy-6-naphthoate synthase, partial [Bacteroidota bacterium]|nr:1,4-dihydroxy-6-naphthoate synthase [Bacteroidota bacterium]
HTTNAELTLGFSPCPNDCFIFDAMIHGKVDTEGLTFRVVMEDVESLNQRAFKSELDITKLSYHAYAHLIPSYQLLNAGSALGNNCGPLLVAKKDLQINKDTIIAIPGKYTTANFLLSLAFPAAMNKVEMVFSEIEEAVLNGIVDAGLIIHENRFTYELKGLKKIIDLGEFWEDLAKAPIPLGGIVTKRKMPEGLKNKIDRVMRRSVEFAFAHPDASRKFVIEHAQEMDEEVMKKHIELYVNHYSVELGAEGKRAVKILFNKAMELGVIGKMEEDIFLPDH